MTVDPVVDAGLAAERTRLAWQRTALSVAGVGALSVHTGLRGSSPEIGWLPGVLMMLSAAALWLYAVRRYRSTVAAVRAGRSTAIPSHIRLFSLLCLLPAALGLWTVLS